MNELNPYIIVGYPNGNYVIMHYQDHMVLECDNIIEAKAMFKLLLSFEE